MTTQDPQWLWDPWSPECEGLANCQLDTAPQVKRLPLPAPVMLSILELAEHLLPIVR